MTQVSTASVFSAKLLQPARYEAGNFWAFVVLPREVSDKLPRRGRTTVDGTLNAQRFRQTLEPDGKLSHWLQVSREVLESAGARVGDTVTLQIAAVDNEPEPAVPEDIDKALAASPKARKVWNETTTIARVDWIHWITSAKQSKTRAKRIADASSMLSSGKKRVCCFDPSGYYSKALQAPEAAE